jgi:hypothetical protein
MQGSFLAAAAICSLPSSSPRRSSAQKIWTSVSVTDYVSHVRAVIQNWARAPQPLHWHIFYLVDFGEILVVETVAGHLLTKWRTKFKSSVGKGGE